ncbi:LysR family transcriptional regulator [Streptomyces sp. NPDC090306]|uniref:LysR family transcriptional regulator n=1 Tax=unclassified Streptomyces TaxID=2593676 RepID=UPI0036E91C7D
MTATATGPAAHPADLAGPGAALAHVDLNLLRTFLAVYRQGSFTAAAPLLGLSQPTVTAQIRSLEQQTGQELFHRLPRGAEPTQPAHELAGQISGPLDALARLGGREGAAAGQAAPVHLGGPSELLCTRVLPALAPLVADGVEVRIAQGLTDPLLDDLRAGRHDLVITTRRPRGRALTSYPLADEEYVLVAAPEWARRMAEAHDEGDACGPGEDGVPELFTVDGELCVDDLCADLPCAALQLRHVPLVAFAEDLPIARRYWRTVFGKQLTTRAALTVPNLHAVVAAVTAGAGYSVLPRSLCEEHLRTGRLVLLHSPAEPPLNTLFLVQRPGADSNPDVVRVRARLQDRARAW